MYETHFGLRRRPFRATPDIDAYYPATTHEQCLADVQQALAGDEGLVLLHGDPGTGKTILCHRLIERLGPDTSVAFLAHGRLPSRTALLQAILFDLSLPYEGRSEQELRLALTDHLLQKNAAGQATILILDEAHHLDADLLEELRLLGNLEIGTAKAVQTVLVAQSTILNKLHAAELNGLRQRLATRCRLEPLGLEEAIDFLVHQIRAAGGRPNQVISTEALEVVAQGTHGIPRLLCQAGHRALCLAHAAAAAQVDAEAALEALTSLGLGDEAPTPVHNAGPDDLAGPGTSGDRSMIDRERTAVFTVGLPQERAEEDEAPWLDQDGVITSIAIAPRKPA